MSTYTVRDIDDVIIGKTDELADAIELVKLTAITKLVNAPFKPKIDYVVLTPNGNQSYRLQITQTN